MAPARDFCRIAGLAQIAVPALRPGIGIEDDTSFVFSGKVDALLDGPGESEGEDVLSVEVAGAGGYGKDREDGEAVGDADHWSDLTGLQAEKSVAQIGSEAGVTERAQIATIVRGRIDRSLLGENGEVRSGMKCLLDHVGFNGGAGDEDADRQLAAGLSLRGCKRWRDHEDRGKQQKVRRALMIGNTSLAPSPARAGRSGRQVLGAESPTLDNDGDRPRDRTNRPGDRTKPNFQLRNCHSQTHSSRVFAMADNSCAMQTFVLLYCFASRTRRIDKPCGQTHRAIRRLCRLLDMSEASLTRIADRYLGARPA